MYVTAIVIVTLLTSCPSSPNIETEWSRVKELIQYNLVCITGNSDESNYVEVSYSEYDAISGKNKVVTKNVTPPCIIGGHWVQIEKMPTTSNKSSDTTYYFYFKTSYQEAAYLSINNRSNTPIEYCFVPVQVSKSNSSSSCKSKPYVYRYPLVNYKNLPIYYWMFPERNSLWGDFFAGDCLPITWQTPSKTLTINEVLQLYREEFNNSNTTKLYVTYGGLYPIKRVKDIEKNDYYQYAYYGSIANSSTINMGAEYPVLALPILWSGITLNNQFEYCVHQDY